MTRSSRTLLIGIDGGTFDLIEPWVAQGQLPTFAMLLKGGVHAPLKSTIPPVTPLAWSSLITGCNPGQHGIYGFLSRKPGTSDWYPTSAYSRSGLSLWEWAGRQGKRIGVFNMPMTYPPERIPHGYMVSGLGVPDVDVQFALPEELQPSLLRRFTPEQLVEQPASLYDNDSFLDYLLRSVDNNLAGIHYLLDRYPDTDLLCAVLTATDRVQHFYWRQMTDPEAPPRQRTAIRQVYRRIDDALADLLQRYPERTLMLMSDHGAGPYRHLVGMNSWLAQQGWLRWRDEKRQTHGWWGTLWRRAYHVLGHAMPSRVRHALKQWMPHAVMSGLRAGMGHWTLPVTWSQTKVYSAGFGGNLYLNLIGREPEGVVHPGAEAQAILDEVTSALYELRDPETHAPVVRRVYRSEEIYQGTRVSEAPDLVVAWHDGYYSMAGLEGADGSVFQGHISWPDSKVVHSAEHRQYGILIGYGPMVAQGSRLSEADIIDLAPTLVHMLGLPVPSTMEGQVLLDMLRDDAAGPRYAHVSQESHAGWQSTYSEEDEQSMQDRLRALGYLD
jgi:predicted AlkP superfamily phosphohydrolase/phosphomutase